MHHHSSVGERYLGDEVIDIATPCRTSGNHSTEEVAVVQGNSDRSYDLPSGFEVHQRPDVVRVPAGEAAAPETVMTLTCAHSRVERILRLDKLKSVNSRVEAQRLDRSYRKVDEQIRGILHVVERGAHELACSGQKLKERFVILVARVVVPVPGAYGATEAYVRAPCHVTQLRCDLCGNGPLSMILRPPVTELPNSPDQAPNDRITEIPKKGPMGADRGQFDRFRIRFSLREQTAVYLHN